MKRFVSLILSVCFLFSINTVSYAANISSRKASNPVIQSIHPKQILFSLQAICHHRLRRRFTAIIKDIFSHHRPIRDTIQI